MTRSQPSTRPPPPGIGAGWPLLVVVVAVALNLRPAIAAVPPLLDTIQSDLGLSATGAGLLTALPVVCMGLFAPVGAALARRVGREAAVSCALALVAAGTLVRGAGASAVPLYGGTLVAGVGIAIGGVLLPGVVKAWFPDRPGAVTGLYTAGLVAGNWPLVQAVRAQEKGIGRVMKPTKEAIDRRSIDQTESSVMKRGGRPLAAQQARARTRAHGS